MIGPEANQLGFGRSLIMTSGLRGTDIVHNSSESMKYHGLEAMLFEMLAEYQISVPEVGTFTAAHLPWVVLTSNDTRDRSAALARRGLHLHLASPEPERELEIIHSKPTALPGVLVDRDAVRDALAVTLIKDRRDLPAFDEVFDGFLALRRVGDPDDEHYDHTHDDLCDEATSSCSRCPTPTPVTSHSSATTIATGTS
jgi:hypothetical protein